MLVFESEKERNGALMVARKYAIDCNVSSFCLFLQLELQIFLHLLIYNPEFATAPKAEVFEITGNSCWT